MMPFAEVDQNSKQLAGLCFDQGSNFCLGHCYCEQTASLLMLNAIEMRFKMGVAMIT